MLNNFWKDLKEHPGFSDKEARRLDRESERYEKRFERAEMKRHEKREKEAKDNWL